MPSSRQFVWSLRASAPDLTLLTDGIYQPDPKWVLGFAFADQSTEDLASPCEFSWRLQPRERAHIVASATAAGFDDPHTQDFVAGLADQIRKAERTRRRLFRNEIDRTADQYVATGRRGATILSGYPGGGEMGSAAMIAVRGIALSPGRLHLAGEVLETWRRRLATGLMPSGIAEDRCVPSWHSPAPALWYITAVYEYLRASNRHGRPIAAPERASLAASVHDILRNFAERRHRHIFMDEDALIAEAVPGKHGAFEGALRKRAHIQALWIAALRIGDHLQSTRSAIYEAARAQFERTFWNSRRGFLYREVLSSADQPLSRVETLNLNQILAVGGLPIVCIREDRASLLVQALEGHFHPGNGARGQKRIPWQFGPFIEAWFRVHHRNPEVKDRILKTFIAPWEAELRSCARGAGLGHPHPEAHEKAALPWFTAVEATELQRILHLPELIDRPDPFDDSLGEPFCP